MTTLILLKRLAQETDALVEFGFVDGGHGSLLW
jgi:hypothetical protein